ncbi:transposase, partial [Candidatus Bathyarchaeota archaeon]|nr:transposase [Candidatus Bathyarchaeota archaeon]
ANLRIDSGDKRVWTRSYFCSTAGNVSNETIRKYIEAQSKK